MSSYNIDWQSGGDEGIPGKQDIILAPKGVDNSTSLTLTGRGLANYGEIQQENFIRLMEHFASSTPPENPTVGQQWYHTSEQVLYLCVDVATISASQTVYFPVQLTSPPATIGWVQIASANAGSSAGTFAALSEYSVMAAAINRVIGAATEFGALNDIEDRQYGWGQSDLVPEYLTVNKLKPGFDPLIYPPQFDNSAWAILLSRLRKALRYIGRDERVVSPVGFISDGRPSGTGNARANEYNNSGAGGAGQEPNILSGWNNFGQPTLQMFYASTADSIRTLEDNRCVRPTTANTIASNISSVIKTVPWSSTISYQVQLAFANRAAANAYFNSGGYFQFDMSLTNLLPTPNTISMYWRDWLDAMPAPQFDYKGVQYAGVYMPAPSNEIIGFYDLTSTYKPIFVRRRDLAVVDSQFQNPASVSIIDSGVRISAKAEVIGGKYVVSFEIAFVEDPVNSTFGSGNISGTLTSAISGHRANTLNMNMPGIFIPAVHAIIPPSGL